MKRLEGARLITMMLFLEAAHGIFVVGPKFIQANQNYSVVICNESTKKVNLVVTLEGKSNKGLNVLNDMKLVNLGENMHSMVNFMLPGDLVNGMYKISFDEQRSTSFHMEVGLVFRSKSIAGLIQISQPVFNPGDTVKFRLIVLDAELKPPASVKALYVTIQDSQRNVIRKWDSPKLYAGVFENDLHIQATPILGVWNILVHANGEELVSKTFEVKKYVLSTFDVQVVPSVVPLEVHQALNLTIAANYHFGKPVQGLAKIELYLNYYKLDQKKELEMYGTGQIELRFAGFLEVHNEDQDVRVKVSFIEKFTNRTVVKNEEIKVFKYPYRVDLVKESPQFRPGQPFKCELQFRYHDGTPAAGISGNVEVIDTTYTTSNSTSDSNGLIKLELQPDERTKEIDIIFSNDDFDFDLSEKIEREEIVTNAYVKLELKSPIKLNDVLRFIVTCSEYMDFFLYFVVSKGNIIDVGFIKTNRQNNYAMQLIATENMLPQAHIIVVTVATNTVVYDAVDLNFEEFRNEFNLSIDKHEIRPGQQIELNISGQPGAYVALAAYDKALLLHSKNHYLFLADFERVFEDLHGFDRNEHDVLQRMGLFARKLDGSKIDGANERSTREGLQMKNAIYNPNLSRISFMESWLWKNVTIGSTGNRKLIQSVPDSIASWYLTGFSIDPVYGFAIIKKPIELKIFRPFFIVDNLPYSIKRGEIILLQFILFNYLEAEYIADVTLHNVNNQVEFVGRSVEERITRSISVPPKIGVPISFQVKAKRLGEMVVRVQASLAQELETDALVKVIRVLPESFLISNKESKSFCHVPYTTFHSTINKKADKNSNNITLKFIPKSAGSYGNDFVISLYFEKSTRYLYWLFNEEIIYKNIPEDTKSVNITIQGTGCGLMEMIYQYSLDLRNFQHRFNLNVIKLNTNTDYELKLRVCVSFIPDLTTSRSNMAQIEVNFPSGYVVDQNHISAETSVNPIQNIEIRFGGTTVFLYYHYMGIENNCFTVTSYRRYKMAFKRPAYVVVYDYYDRNLNAIKAYEVDEEQSCKKKSVR